MNSPSRRRIAGARRLLAFAALAALQAGARAQLFVSHYNPAVSTDGVVSEYSTSGTLLNPAFALDGGQDVAVSGSYVYTLDSSGNIGKYTLSGATVASTLATASGGSQAFAIFGSDIFVANSALNTVEEYTTSGTLVTKTLITGLPTFVEDIAVSGSDLFIANDGAISEYTTGGALVDADFIPPTFGASFVAVDGSDLYTNDFFGISEYTTSGTLLSKDFISVFTLTSSFAIDGSDVLLGGGVGDAIREYTLSGNLLNPAFVTGVYYNPAIAVAIPSAVPEGPLNSLLCLGAVAFALLVGRRRQGA